MNNKKVADQNQPFFYHGIRGLTADELKLQINIVD